MFTGVAFSQQSYPYYGPQQGYPATQGSYPGPPQPYSQQPVYPSEQTYPPQQDYSPQQSGQQRSAAQDAALLSPDQLNNLVAPIALYPDPVLSQVLAAATYPLEVVEAEQWVRQQSNLQGAQLVDAARQMNWDPERPGARRVSRCARDADARRSLDHGSR